MSYGSIDAICGTGCHPQLAKYLDGCLCMVQEFQSGIPYPSCVDVYDAVENMVVKQTQAGG